MMTYVSRDARASFMRVTQIAFMTQYRLPLGFTFPRSIGQGKLLRPRDAASADLLPCPASQ